MKKLLTALFATLLMITVCVVAPVSASAAENTSASVSAASNIKSLSMGVGETYSVAKSGAAYKSSASSVATVSSGGKITAKKAGKTTVTVKSGNQTYTYNITVKKMATSLSLNKTSLTMGVGESYDLNSTVPAGTAACYRPYSSSNTGVASVTKSGGLITAKKAGTATITCKLNNGTKATCKVTVKKMATSLTLNKTSITLGVGETYDLNSTVPSGTAACLRPYTSSDSSVATVTKSGGLITAKKAGTATITCTLNNGTKATCKVTVKKLATSLTLNKTSITLGVGESYDLNSTVPTGTAAYYRYYSSDNTGVATVSKSGGLVKAKKAGTATITCKLNNGTKAACKVTVKKMATGLTLNATDIVLAPGLSVDLDSYVPSGTAAFYRNYSSSNSSVASVTKGGGIVTAKKDGTATITCTLTNGVKATCKVTVREYTYQEQDYLVRNTAQNIADYICDLAYGVSDNPSDLEVVSLAAKYIGECCNHCEYSEEDEDAGWAYGVFIKGVYNSYGASGALSRVCEALADKGFDITTQSAYNEELGRTYCLITADGKDGWADGFNGNYVYYPDENGEYSDENYYLEGVGAGYGEYGEGMLPQFTYEDGNDWMEYYGLY